MQSEQDLMRSDSGALTPEFQIAAAMEHRQYDDAVPFPGLRTSELRHD
jgi:hypothetical protein